MIARLSKILFILTLVVIKLAGSVASAQAPANPDAKPDIVGNSRVARWKLRQAGIKSITTTQASDPKDQLKQVIDRVQLLKPPKPKPTTAADIQPIQPVHPTPAAKTQVLAPPKPQKSQMPKAPTTNYTNRALTALIANPQSVVDPLAVAESLFHQGNLKAAAKFYNLALERLADETNNPNRPWAIFQAANCIRQDDPAGANKLYQQLITQYPASDWTAAAHSQQQIITWYQQNSPKKILEKYIRDPNSL
jgi:tetratricopeptide (TPR) repeat protein